MKKISILIIALSIILAVAAVFYFYSGQKSEMPLQAGCLKAGEFSKENVLVSSQSRCCEGLDRIFYAAYDAKQSCEELSRIAVYGYVCSDCGDNICESWENRCNCQKDCKFPGG